MFKARVIPTEFTEGAGESVYRFILQDVDQAEISMSAAVVGGTAVEGVDFQHPEEGWVLYTDYMPGDPPIKEVWGGDAIGLTDDNIIEGTETIKIRISSPSLRFENGKDNYTFEIKVRDNDAASGKADTFQGSTGVDTFDGLAGNDRISGRGGNDRLSGGLGRDVFVFDTALDTRRNVDVITDFSHRKDSFELDKTVFRGLAAGELKDFRFKIVDDDSQKKGIDKSDRILYDKGDGDLFFDRDGSGTKYGPVKFAEVKNHTYLEADDFLIV